MNVPSETFQDYLREVRESMAHMHPNVAKYPDIAVLLANEIAYGLWRKKRVYDHVEIAFGARTPDGTAGYTIGWYDEREGGRKTAITLTRAELQELVDKGVQILGDR